MKTQALEEASVSAPVCFLFHQDEMGVCLLICFFSQHVCISLCISCIEPATLLARGKVTVVLPQVPKPMTLRKLCSLDTGHAATLCPGIMSFCAASNICLPTSYPLGSHEAHTSHAELNSSLCADRRFLVGTDFRGNVCMIQ